MDNLILINKKIILTRKEWMTLNLFVSFLLLLLIEVFAIDIYNELFLLYALWQLFLYGGLALSELRYPGLNIMLIFFVGAVMSVAYPSFDYSRMLLDGDKVYCNYDYNDISKFVFRTAVAINIYYSSFILLLTKFTKERLFIIDIQNVAKRFNLFFLSIIIYLIATILRIIPFLELISSTLASLANNLPMLVLLLLAVYCGTSSKHDKHYRLFVILLIVEIVYTLFFGYYKSAVARTAAMYVIYYYLFCRTNHKSLLSVQAILCFILFIVFFLYIVYPFITLKRIESNYTAANDLSSVYKVDNFEILRRVLTGDYVLFDDSNANAFGNRMSAISSNAFFYQEAYNGGSHNNMLVMSLKKMIPGILWSNKPTGSPGMIAKNYIVMRSFDKDAVSAAYMGLFASAYFWGGWFGAVVMCILNAFVLSILLKICFSHLDNLFSWLVIFFVVFNLLRCFEEMTDGGVSQNLMFLIYAGIICISSKKYTLSPRKPKL